MLPQELPLFYFVVVFFFQVYKQIVCDHETPPPSPSPDHCLVHLRDFCDVPRPLQKQAVLEAARSCCYLAEAERRRSIVGDAGSAGRGRGRRGGYCELEFYSTSKDEKRSFQTSNRPDKNTTICKERCKVYQAQDQQARLQNTTTARLEVPHQVFLTVLDRPHMWRRG